MGPCHHTVLTGRDGLVDHQSCGTNQVGRDPAPVRCRTICVLDIERRASIIDATSPIVCQLHFAVRCMVRISDIAVHEASGQDRLMHSPPCERTGVDVVLLCHVDFLVVASADQFLVQGHGARRSQITLPIATGEESIHEVLVRAPWRYPSIFHDVEERSTCERFGC